MAAGVAYWMVLTPAIGIMWIPVSPPRKESGSSTSLRSFSASFIVAVRQRRPFWYVMATQAPPSATSVTVTLVSVGWTSCSFLDFLPLPGSSSSTFTYVGCPSVKTPEEKMSLTPSAKAIDCARSGGLSPATLCQACTCACVATEGVAAKVAVSLFMKTHPLYIVHFCYEPSSDGSRRVGNL